jgi:hypothetical protein
MDYDLMRGLIPVDGAYVAPPSNMYQNVPKSTPLYRNLYDPIRNPVDEGFRTQQNIMPNVTGEAPSQRLMPDIEKAPKPKKTRRNSIEGDTIGEIVNNIIKEKPSLKLLNKAFQRMVDMIEEERESLELEL